MAILHMTVDLSWPEKLVVYSVVMLGRWKSHSEDCLVLPVTVFFSFHQLQFLLLIVPSLNPQPSDCLMG